MSDYFKARNKPIMQKGYQSVIYRNIIPLLGRMKVRDVMRPNVAAMKQMAHTPADKSTHRIGDEGMRKLFHYLGLLEA